jgi:threonyl-tRNA synthetase
MEEHEKGREAFASDEAYKLHCLRHSTAHVMAQAILALHPTAKLAIGPAIEDGFYYDVDVNKPITEEDLGLIETEMKRIVKENQPFVQEEWSAEKALQWFGERHQDYKIELIQGFGSPTVGVFKNPMKDGGEFVDLCKGPHVRYTSATKHFKLLKVSGAYWRGDSTKAQLQRIYGTVWATREELDTYLFRIEEAKKRDHRKLGRELDLFMFHDWAPGAAFWLPRGEDLYNTLAVRMRALLTSNGYVAVRTPLVFDKKLWETSGHWQHYRGNMFHFPEFHHDASHPHADTDEETEQRHLGLKAMNCPAHMLIYRSKKHSYRELPIRIHDQGVLHRNELSGALSGLTRVRQFSQDDAHIFCMESQIGDEVGRLLDLVAKIYPAFDLGYAIKLSTRPAEKLGDDAMWDRAESALQEALDTRGLKYTINAGDGAFYGPKIDFDVLDALGRPFQCATIQLDFQNPIRFDLTYVGADNAVHLPVVIHRAILGSFERFIGMLIEHYAGNFPTWLAPEQARVLTVSEKSVAYGETVYAELKKAGIKATIDKGDDKVGYKIREAALLKLPYLVVVGERDAEGNTVSVRARGNEDLGAMPVAAFVERVVAEAKPPF